MSTRRRVIEIAIFIAGFVALVFFLPTGHRPSEGARVNTPAAVTPGSDHTALAVLGASVSEPPSGDTEFATEPLASSSFHAPIAGLTGPSDDLFFGGAPNADIGTGSTPGSPSPATPGSGGSGGPQPQPSPSPAPSPSPTPSPSPSPSPSPAPTGGPGPSPQPGTSSNSGSGSTPSANSGSSPTTSSTTTTTTTTTTRPSSGSNGSGSTPGGHAPPQ